MKQPYKYVFASLAAFLAIQSPAYADGPSGAFFVYFGGAIFAAAQMWIIASEFIYLAFLYRGVAKIRLLWWCTLINLASSIVGIAPLVFFHVYMIMHNTGHLFGYLTAFILATYPLSVLIEGWLLYLLSRHTHNRPMHTCIMHSCGFNAISYSGLLLLIARLCLS